MSKPPTSWRDLNPRRLNQLAREVLGEFGLVEARLLPISASENRLWKVLADRDCLVLRCHRPPPFEIASLPAPTRNEIECELQWLRFLRERVSFRVPEPLASRHGEQVLTTAWEESLPLHWTVLRWIPGRQLRKSLRPAHMSLAGEMVGELHACHGSADHPQLQRPSWDHARLSAAFEELQPLRITGDLDSATWNTLVRIRDQVGQLLDSLSFRGNAFGMIHADIHPGNLLWVGNRVSLIDFSSCGFGSRAFDIAQLLTMAPDDSYWEAFWKGYARTSPTDSVIASDARTLTGYCSILWLNYNAPTQLKRVRPRIPRVLKRVLSIMGLEDYDGLRTPSPSS